VPASLGFPADGLRGALLNELLELWAEKKMASLNISITTPLQGFSNLEFSNILHKPSSIHLIPAGTALVNSPLGLGVCSPPHNDSVAYVRIGCCVIQPAATDHLNSQNPKVYAILKKNADRILGGVLLYWRATRSYRTEVRKFETHGYNLNITHAAGRRPCKAHDWHSNGC